MELERFNALIARLEVYAREHPTAYKTRLGLFAALGFLYLFVVIFVLLLLVGSVLFYVGFNVLVLKVLWIPLVLIGIVLRSLWVDFPEPDGLHLKYSDAVLLFDLVKEIETAFQSPHVHHILMTDDFNASVMQVPRLGMFGWHKNYVLVGLPLMQALSPDQFRAVIAHEMGHLSGKHSRFAGWIYRVRQTWIQIVTSIHAEQRHGAFIFEGFLNWYAPFFSAYSFVLARAQELEADAHAVELAGKENAAKALINLEIKSRFLAEDFWPKFYKQADVQAQPPTDVFAQFVSASQHQVPTDAARKWFRLGMAAQTGYEDTHPSLADRLTAIGYAVTSARDAEYRHQLFSSTEPNEPAASQFYLGSMADNFISSRNLWWKEQVQGVWRERHRFVKEVQESLRKLEEKAKTQTLSLEEQWELVRGIAETQGLEAALPYVRAILNANPDDLSANISLGNILLGQDDESGIEYIERAMTLDQETTISGCEAIFVFLKERGRDEDAEPYRVRAEQHYKATIAVKNK